MSEEGFRLKVSIDRIGPTRLAVISKTAAAQKYDAI
jgi:hypothetical protein